MEKKTWFRIGKVQFLRFERVYHWGQNYYILFFFFLGGGGGEYFQLLLQETLQHQVLEGINDSNVMVCCCSSLEATNISVTVTSFFLSVLCGMYSFSFGAGGNWLL